MNDNSPLPEADRQLGAILFLRAQENASGEARDALESWVGRDDARRDLIGTMASFCGAVDGIGDDEAVQAWLEEARSSGRTERRSMVSAGRLAIAAVLLMAVALSTALLLPGPEAATDRQVASGIGERRLVLLPDGTRIRLDAASRIAIDYGSDRRIVRLLAGQARFQVAHDAQRPFHVAIGSDDVRALGTDFNVGTTLSTMAVSLIEGSVLVSRLERRPAFFGWREQVVRIPTVRLQPGQEFERRGSAPPSVRRFDPQVVTAWQNGRLMFKDLPLPDAVALANRYSRRPIVVDPQLPTIGLTAVVNAGDGVGLAKAITAYIPHSHVDISDTQIAIRKGEENFSPEDR